MAEVRDFMKLLLDAVAQVNALGFVHRDIKVRKGVLVPTSCARVRVRQPANVLWRPNPHGPPALKLIDFGLAETLDELKRAAVLQQGRIDRTWTSLCVSKQKPYSCCCCRACGGFPPMR